MKTIKNKIIVLGLMLLVLNTGCEIMDLNQQDSPSQLTPASVDPELLLNNVQLQFVSAIAYNEDNEDGINVRASEFIRMQHLFGAYAGPFSLTAGSIDDIWTGLYRECLQDINILLPLAAERELAGYTGVAKILQAYIYVTLVDTFGKVPYSEALLGNENPNPSVDDGADIYNAMFTIIDEGIAAINTPNAVMPNDLFYGGNKSQWLKMARTLKFKMYAQMRLVGDYSSQINSLISSGIIENSTDDFQFQYSTVASTTGDSRHPYFALNYDPDGADDYLTGYYVNLLLADKGFEDPRLRYYFYRQIEEAPTGDDLPCEGEPGYNFCYLGDYYWTRDHGDDDGVPPDGPKRTTYGLYPIGGKFDADDFTSVTANSGAQGAGIFPFMLSSFVKFLKSESALMAGTTGNPRTLLEEGIRASMDKVINFYPGLVDATFAATQADVDAYVTYVLGQYDAAANDEERLDIIMKEYYIALWGNGIEAWNNYRRTSMPSDLTPHVKTPGAFPRTFLYPATVVNTNSNIEQKPITEKVFWDTNPDDLK
ncbi:SusD/RagB family nutrient-binding outer membrane lipoprotein [Aestuariibaculum sediminum]|uniref:SusD/RagB family nutrient-binding outer membrane lipoprotein n=1 Tax=Aestuariibaculum sediminum TaxID=2770637 RepID=A0A8J6U814_9FLAO|nr:SusD/RagB family nutrient-binding outer membrane lipoprotein [Aestuariibaculum sediminum]MBD0830702.1 SusD/RagB family nutrient-binding outer membrane lipoprotein [Aestuariibaculum sediminum]